MATKKIFWLIFLFTFVIRVIGIDKLTIYPDEITWMVKGKEALYALKAFNLDYFKYGWWNSLTDTYAIGWPMVIMGGLSHIIFAGAGKFSLNLISDILSVRLPETLISSFIPSVLFYYASQFLSLEVSLFAALALSLSPISMGIDRWFIHDSFLSLFFLLSMGSYLKSYKEKKVSPLPGIWLALGALTKPLGVIPVLGWLIMFNKKTICFKSHNRLFYHPDSLATKLDRTDS
jgi:4-amino-4-deoxy-L-arabinose transferase-like glycosyltransferase